MSLCSEVLKALSGRSLVTAESLTGGGIGAALTAVPGASEVYLGGIISYCDQIKQAFLGVDSETLDRHGAVSRQTAAQMAAGARERMKADIAVSVTGLAGPGGDSFGHEVGTVFVGYCSGQGSLVRECHFAGNREEIRQQTIRAALELILEMSV